MATVMTEKPSSKAPDAWQGFSSGLWMKEINLRAFIQRHVTPYHGDEAFLAGPTARTQAMPKRLQALYVANSEARARKPRESAQTDELRELGAP